jgi:hypothetical protein
VVIRGGRCPDVSLQKLVSRDYSQAIVLQADAHGSPEKV